MDKRPVSATDVGHELAAAALGYVLGLVVLLVWPDREHASQPGLVAVGSGVLVITAVLVGWFAFHGFAVFRRRPHRYSWPNAIGLAIAMLWASTPKAGPDSALQVYVVASPVIALGATISEILWLRASARRAIEDE